ASPGNMLPTADDAERLFSGKQGDRPKTKLEVLIEAEELKPFNGTGSMRAAFTTKSTKPDWDSAIEKRAEKIAEQAGHDGGDEATEGAERGLRGERAGERRAMMAWVRAGAKKEDFDRDIFVLPQELVDEPITPNYVTHDAKVGKAIKVSTLLNDRCFRCHKP